MTIKNVSIWTCDCICGCKTEEFGNLIVYSYRGTDPEIEALEPRENWAELANTVICPECRKNVEPDLHNTIKLEGYYR